MTLNKTFSALSDPTRRTILDLLKQKSLPVGDIALHFTITLPTLSHHLNVLKQANLVTTERQGQQIIYSLNLSVFEEIAKDLYVFFNKTKPPKRHG